MNRLIPVLCLAASVLAFAQAPAARKAAKPAPAPVAKTPAAEAFVGNKESKTFHRAGCAHAGKIKASNRIAFATAAEAAKAGYKPCKVCKPQ